MIKRKWIDEIIDGLVQSVGSNDIYDIASYLGLRIIKDNYIQNPLLKESKGFYIRSFNNKEIIVIRDDLEDEKQIIAHELGHAVLHTDYDTLLHSRLSNRGKNEREANYFATKLLYSDLEIEDGIETYKQLADSLGLNEDNVKYIVD